MGYRTLERSALALFAAGRVSSACDGAVPVALQVLGNGIAEDLRRRAIVLVGKVALDRVGINSGGHSVVLHREIPAHDISRTSRARSYLHRGACRTFLNTR